jgi:hypothetical protein
MLPNTMKSQLMIVIESGRRGMRATDYTDLERINTDQCQSK